MKKFIILGVFFYFAYAKNYVGYCPLEPDTALTFWAIQKYKDKDAKFFLGDKKSVINLKKAMKINTSDAKIKRNGRFTAFEIFLYKNNIKSNKCIKKLIKMDKVLEMMPWMKNQFPDILAFENKLRNLSPKNRGKVKLKRLFHYIDNFCMKNDK